MKELKCLRCNVYMQNDIDDPKCPTCGYRYWK